MDKITVIFTTREWNPVSWLIRWCLPRSRFANALASHCMIIDGDHIIEANMMHGVRRIPLSEALIGCVEVARIEYHVPCAEDGLQWAREQVPKPYDWLGAFGLALAPGRNWQDETDWFCFELVAAALAKAGLDVFDDHGHITGSMLMAIKP